VSVPDSEAHLDELLAARAGVDGDELAAERARVYARLAAQHRQRQRCARLGRYERMLELAADTDELLDRLLELRAASRG